MRHNVLLVLCVLLAVTAGMMAVPHFGDGADHNDPNAVNSIFSDIAIQPADLYGMFGYPSDDRSNGEKVVVQLTFASIPQTGVFDMDMLYTVNLDADTRILDSPGDADLEGMISYVRSVKDKYLRQEPSQVRVTFETPTRARLTFLNFPSGDFTTAVDTDEVETVQSPDGHAIQVFVGGRDDPFFNDLPGFFRSINYGPQFYDIPISADREYRELPIPKTLLELEGNTLFNFDPARPQHGSGVKLPMPDGSISWEGRSFLRDEEGNYRFVYSGNDAQAGFDVNAIVLEIPLEFVTERPEVERVVRVWGESWVLRASGKVEHALLRRGSWWTRFKAWLVDMFGGGPGRAVDGINIRDYKLVDHVGVPFADAALGEREDEKVGHDNIRFGHEFVRRFAHLGWGFGPSITALGLGTCFDHGDSQISVQRTYNLALPAFARVGVQRCQPPC